MENNVEIRIEDVTDLVIADSRGTISSYTRLNNDLFENTCIDVNYEYWCEICMDEFDPSESTDGKCPACHGEGQPVIISENDLIKIYNGNLLDKENGKKIFVNGVCIYNTL